MADWDISANVTLQLRLAVAKEKFAILERAAESLENQILGDHSNKTVEEAAKRLRITRQELENTAANLHK